MYPSGHSISYEQVSPAVEIAISESSTKLDQRYCEILD